MGVTSARIVAGLTGLACGVAVGSLIWQQAYVEIAFAVLLAAAVSRLAQLVPAHDRAAMWRLVLLAFAVRAAAGAFLRMASLEIGRDGFISGDDREYYELARDFVAYLRGEPRPDAVPPYWGGAVYLFSTWVYLESVLVTIFGERPLVPVLANGALGAITVLLCWDLTRRMFGRRAAYLVALVLTMHPSLTLWASTSLKDTFALLVIAVIHWSLMRFLERPRPEPLIAIALALVAMQSVRTYIFVGLSLVVPVAVAATPGLNARRRVAWTAAATGLSVVLLAANQAGLGLAPALLTGSIQIRESMAAGARTGFQERPVRVETGTTFVVPGGSGGPSETIVVPPNACIVVVPAGRTKPTSAPGCASSAFVKAGDVVVVGPPGSTPAPEAQRLALPDAGSIQLAPQRLSEEELTRQTLAYLPKGLVFALFAPWPWLSDRTLDLLTLPEMLLWYAAIASLPFSLWLARGRWRYYLGPLLFVGGTLVVFALVQGNWGTLFRHRAMVIPVVFLLAAPGLLTVVGRLRSGPHASDRHPASRAPSTSRQHPV